VISRPRAQTLLLYAAMLGALLVVTEAVLSGSKAAAGLAPLLALVAIVVAAYRRLFRWETLTAALVATILLIPIKRYTVPGNAFNLEPYRLLLAALAAGWWIALLVDRRVRFRKSGLEAPIVVFVFAMLGSVAANDARIQALGVQKEVVKTLTFFASFFILFYLVVSVVRTHGQIHGIVRVLVACTSFVALSALVESRAHYNVFNHLHPLLPGLQFNDPATAAGLDAAYLNRSGVMRVYASSAHPIELSAVLVMVMPLAVYLLKTTGQRRWLVSILLCALGSFATLSRTGIIMMMVCGLVFLWLRPVETRRVWPFLVPAFLAVSIALPHTVGSFYGAFFPKGGLVAEQGQANTGTADGGRLTDIGPSLAEYSMTPLVGQGFGSRISQRLGVVHSVKTTARILDDQWLSSLLETGAIGVVGLLWLFVRTIRRLVRRAREDDGPEGWLAASLAASLYALAVAMLTFDAFGFIQVTILMFLLLGLASSLVKTQLGDAAPAVPR
jgi:O-antigen ligase/polysaccharide polymerase Wzy-like membrane protein